MTETIKQGSTAPFQGIDEQGGIEIASLARGDGKGRRNLLNFDHSIFGFVSSFGFRISDFRSRAARAA